MNMIQISLSLLAATLAVVCPAYALIMRVRSLAGIVLLIALSITASLEIFDLLAMVQPEKMLYWKKFDFMAEGCLPFAWILYSLLFARDGIRDISFLQRTILFISLGFIALPAVVQVEGLIYSPDFVSEPVLFLSRTGFVFYLAIISGLTIALINLEATFANSSGSRRWNIKFEILGVGLLLGGLFVYYCHSFLYRTISMSILSVRSLILLLAVIMIGYSQSRSKERVKIQVSRTLAYKSVVMLVIGVYLIGLGLLSEGMQYLDRSFERLLAISGVIVCGAVLLVLLFSEKIKRKTKVFLSAHFYQDKYDYRAQLLQFTDRLSSARSAEEVSTAIVNVFCETFGMTIGALFLRNEALNGFYLAANRDMLIHETIISQDDSLLTGFTVESAIVDVHDFEPAPGSPLNSMLPANKVSFIIPIRSSDVIIGFIMVGRPLNNGEDYTFEDFDLMNTIAHQAAAALLNLGLSEQLAQVREMEVLGKISAFMIHDLKNLVHTLSLIVANAREYISDPDFQQDMLASLDNTTERMKTLIAKFKNMPAKNALNPALEDLLQLAVSVAAEITGPVLTVSGRPVQVHIDREQFRNVLINLILNAVDATNGSGPVLIETGVVNGWAYTRVVDNGCGISEDFLRQHLFSPFKTTKKAGLGIGLYQCRQIVEAHEGRIEAVSTVGKGSIFTVWLPLKEQSQ